MLWDSRYDLSFFGRGFANPGDERILERYIFFAKRLPVYPEGECEIRWFSKQKILQRAYIDCSVGPCCVRFLDICWADGIKESELRGAGTVKTYMIVEPGDGGDC